MTNKQFRHDFSRGLGAALLALQAEAGAGRLDELVRYGCLHNTTYDMQCEGDRGWYLYQAAKLTRDPAAIEAAVAEKLRRVRGDHWLFSQLASLLYHFAADGSATARAALWRQYDLLLDEMAAKLSFDSPCPRNEMLEWCCVWLTSLDGWRAFTACTRDITTRLMPNEPDFFFYNWFLSNAEDKFGTKRVHNWLAKQAVSSPHFAVLVEVRAGYDAMWAQERPATTLDEVLAAADGTLYNGRGMAMSYARQTDAVGLAALAQAALNEPDVVKQAELLWPFRRDRRYTFTDEVVARWLASDYQPLRDVAFDVMALAPSPATRQRARALLARCDEPLVALSLLAQNPQPCDVPLIMETVKRVRVAHDEGAWHSCFSAACDAAQRLHGQPAVDLLHYLYRETLCGQCRYDIVRALHKKKQLTGALLAQCRWDAYDKTRALAERVQRARGV